VARHKELGLRSGTEVNFGSGPLKRLIVATNVSVVRTVPNDRWIGAGQTWNENWQSNTVPLCIPLAPNLLPWERNWSSAMRNRTLITWPRDSNGTIFVGVHSFSSLSYDRSKASSKANSPHRAIQRGVQDIKILVQEWRHKKVETWKNKGRKKEKKVGNTKKQMRTDRKANLVGMLRSRHVERWKDPPTSSEWHVGDIPDGLVPY
jgi:hypothetical protein